MTRKELAEAMLKGIETPGVKESRGDYLSIHEDEGATPYWACALGCAVIGKYDGNYLLAEKEYHAVERRNLERRSICDIAEILSIDVDLAQEIEDKHFETKSVRRVAGWLMEVE